MAWKTQVMVENAWQLQEEVEVEPQEPQEEVEPHRRQKASSWEEEALHLHI